MTSLSQRINELVNYFSGGNVSKFAGRVGFSETNVRNYIKGTLPKSEFLSNVLDAFEINANWLLQGHGEMLKQNDVSTPEKVLSTSEILKENEFLRQTLELKEELRRQDKELMEFLKTKVNEDKELLKMLNERIKQLESEKK